MKTPGNWTLIETGGGCTALHRSYPSSWIEWLITKSCDPSAPTNPSAPCVLGLCHEDDDTPILQWHCSCLAEALQIAEGAKTL